MYGTFVSHPNSLLLSRLVKANNDGDRKEICRQHGCVFDCSVNGQFRVFPVRVYLDDERVPLRNWYIVNTVQDMINLLVTYEDYIEEISLDHDLGVFDDKETGYDVLLWIEQEVVTNKKYCAPKIAIHTANLSAAIKMKLAASSIHRLGNNS